MATLVMLALWPCWLCCMVRRAGYAVWLSMQAMLLGWICWLCWLPAYSIYASWQAILAKLDRYSLYAG